MGLVRGIFVSALVVLSSVETFAQNLQSELDRLYFISERS